MFFENIFDCQACGYDFDRESNVDDCRKCHESFCNECVDSEGKCVSCFE